MNKALSLILLSLSTTILLSNDMKNAIESPFAAFIIKDDLLPPIQQYTMPNNCVSNDQDVVSRGLFLFHNLNSKNNPDNIPEGLNQVSSNNSIKQYGNCVACHNIENAIGYGDIGPDLHNYKTLYIQSGVRSSQYVYQKIADPRFDNLETHMTINLTNGLMSEREICDITSYILSEKK